jgi:hypothetical protein
MAVKDFKVEILNEPVLRLWSTYFDPISFDLVAVEETFPLAGLRLTEPIRGRQGGFRAASLLAKNARVLWDFGKSEQKFYDAVKAALEKRKTR